MKLFNIFKREVYDATGSKKGTIQKMDKTQLEKVIGGGDGTNEPDTIDSTGITEPKKKGINAVIVR